MEAFPQKGIYRFPGFAEGTVLMRDGTFSSQKLNYNISLDEMHFISNSGDTLSLADPATVSVIDLNGNRFYYDKGYYQAVDSAGKLLLAFRQVLSLQQHRPSAYGMTEPHEGIRTYHFYAANGKTDQIGENEKVTVTAREVYFFGDAYGHFSKADKAFLLNQYNEHQEAIRDFLKANHTNFNRLNDLTQVIKFCAQF